MFHPFGGSFKGQLESLDREELLREAARSRDKVEELKEAIADKDDEIERLKEENRSLNKKVSDMRGQLNIALRLKADADSKHLEEAAASVDENSVDLRDTSGMFIDIGPDASPFFWRDLEALQLRSRALSKHLKAITRLSETFCQTAANFALAANELAMELCRDFRDVEPNCDKKLSLGSTFRKLGEALKEKQVFLDILRFSFENTFVLHMKSFRERYGSVAKENRKQLARVYEEYEAALIKSLSVKRSTLDEISSTTPGGVAEPKENDGALAPQLAARRKQKPNFFASLGNAGHSLSPNLPPSEDKLNEWRRKFELLRFEHVAILNETMSTGRMELIESICGCHYALLAYFHSGHEIAQSMEPYTREIQVLVDRKKAEYGEKHERVRQLRKNVDDIFSDTVASLNRLDTKFWSSARIWNGEIADDEAVTTIGNYRNSLRRSGSVLEQQPRTRRRSSIVLPISKQGYLLKQSSGIKKSWARRWFVLENGQLYYYRPIKDFSGRELEPTFIVNTVLCSVRPIHSTKTKDDLPYCFEIISPNRRVYVLQAESAVERDSWISAIQACTEHMLSMQVAPPPSKTGRQLSFTSEQILECRRADALETLRALNATCVDCGALNPEWASINLGVSMCIACSGIHRSLGVHVSKVRSLSLDQWDSRQLSLMCAIGNKLFNSIYEARLEDEFADKYTRPIPDTPRAEKDAFLRAKYIDRLFVARSSETGLITEQLVSASMQGDLAAMVHMLALRADCNELVTVPENDPYACNALHAACLGASVLGVLYLYQNGASLDAIDGEGASPMELALHMRANELNGGPAQDIVSLLQDFQKQ